MDKAIVIMIFIFYGLHNFASELVITKSEALKQGFQKSTQLNNNKITQINVLEEAPAKHSLPWPVKFMDEKHTIGNNMVEYQNYSNEAYFHGGDDLRIEEEGEVRAPIEGFLQGQYYSYVVDQNTGQLTKYTKSLKEGGDDLYFEVTIQMQNGPLLEFHHINPKTLPDKVLNLILNGGGFVKQGDLLGRAHIWPALRYGERYNHIHYNIILPSGINLNPEYYSSELTDNIPPKIKNIFAIYKSKKIEILGQSLNGIPEELIVSSIDQKGENIYPLPPSSIEVQWNKEGTIGWDFTRNLFNNLSFFPDIRNVYASNIKLSDGRTFTTQGNYKNTEFLFRLKIPSTATSPLTIILKDVSNNTTSRTLNF